MKSGNHQVEIYEADQRRAERKSLCHCGYNDTYTVLMCHGSMEECEQVCEYWRDSLPWWKKLIARFTKSETHHNCDMAHEEEYCVNCDSKIVY